MNCGDHNLFTFTSSSVSIKLAYAGESLARARSVRAVFDRKS